MRKFTAAFVAVFMLVFWVFGAAPAGAQDGGNLGIIVSDGETTVNIINQPNKDYYPFADGSQVTATLVSRDALIALFKPTGGDQQERVALDQVSVSCFWGDGATQVDGFEPEVTAAEVPADITVGELSENGQLRQLNETHYATGIIFCDWDQPVSDDSSQEAAIQPTPTTVAPTPTTLPLPRSEIGEPYSETVAPAEQPQQDAAPAEAAKPIPVAADAPLPYTGAEHVIIAIVALSLVGLGLLCMNFSDRPLGRFMRSTEYRLLHFTVRTLMQLWLLAMVIVRWAAHSTTLESAQYQLFELYRRIFDLTRPGGVAVAR